MLGNINKYLQTRTASSGGEDSEDDAQNHGKSNFSYIRGDDAPTDSDAIINVTDISTKVTSYYEDISDFSEVKFACYIY